MFMIERYRYKLNEVAFLIHKLLQRVKVRVGAGRLGREEDGGDGEGLREGVGGRIDEDEAEKREWKFDQKEGHLKADMMQVTIMTEK